MIICLVWLESEDHKILQAGKDLRRSAVQPLAQNWDSSEASPGCSGFIQPHLKNLQEHRLLDLFGQTSSISGCQSFFLISSLNLSCFNICPLLLFQPRTSVKVTYPWCPQGTSRLLTDHLQSRVFSTLPAPSAPHCRASAPTPWPSWCPSDELHFSNTFPILRQPLLNFPEFH